MKSNFVTGYRCNLAFYIIEFVAIIIIGFAFERLNIYFLSVFTAFAVITTLILWRGKKKRPMSENVHKIFQSICFVFASGFASAICDSAQVFVYSLIFSCIVGFIFLDVKFARFQLYLSIQPFAFQPFLQVHLV